MDLTAVFLALANPNRQRILSSMRDPERHFPPSPTDTDMTSVGVCVSQVAEFLDVTPATASQFLAQLRDAGLLESERIGKFTYYRRVESQFEAAALALRNTL